MSRTRIPSRTETQVQTRTRVATDRSLAAAGLSATEEQVLRMRHGLTLASDATLEFHGEGQHRVSPEAAAQLAAIEARAIEHLRASRPRPSSQEQAIADEILGGLRNL